MSQGDFLRIGDAEREQAAALLAEHFVAGRITHDEHTERLERIWAARTRADIVPLFSDLPVLPPAYPAPSGSRPAFGPPRRRSRGPLVALLLVLVVLSAVTELPLIVAGLVAWVLVAGRHRGHQGPVLPQWGHRPKC